MAPKAEEERGSAPVLALRGGEECHMAAATRRSLESSGGITAVEQWGQECRPGQGDGKQELSSYRRCAHEASEKPDGKA